MSAITARDKGGVIRVWELQGKPAFSLWESAKKFPAFSCGDDDEGKREEMLNQALDIIRDSATTSEYTLKMHDEAKGKINNNTPVIGAASFRFNEQLEKGGMGTIGAAGGGGNMSLMKELFESKLDNFNTRWEQKLADLQRDHEAELAAMEEETELKKGSSKHLGMIGMIGDAGDRYPWMQEPINGLLSIFKDAIKDFATVATHKIMKRSPEPAAAAGGIGKIPTDATPDVIMRQALDTLIKYNTRRFGWPPGTTAEQMEAATPEEKQAAHAAGFTRFAATLAKLTELCDDDDVYDLAIKKLNQL